MTDNYIEGRVEGDEGALNLVAAVVNPEVALVL
jgi:hypothetical protein